MYSLSIILLSVSEAHVVEITVMEVFREERSVRRIRTGSNSVSDKTVLRQEVSESLAYHLQQVTFLHHFKYCI